ncbi:MAG: hypothetical protein RL497_2949, partial [Pseudomonadota bacterium]
METSETLAAPPQPAAAIPAHLTRQLYRFTFTVLPILIGLHTYIGWRLLPALPISTAWAVLGGVLLALSALLMPLGMLGRFLPLPQAWADRLSWA